MIIFGSVQFLLKKITKLKFFFFKNRNRVKPTGFGSVFLEQKPVRTGLVRFFRFWLCFLGFGSVFSGLARFFFGLARFFFWFFVGFGSVRFFRLFFFRFSRFNRFSGFFAHPYFQVLTRLPGHLS